MTNIKRVMIDAGHGGTDPGAGYLGRAEKNDVLNLALAVGDVLADNGVEVVYTRADDTYNTPSEKAAMGNDVAADYFISLHRNAISFPNTATGVETLVFEDLGVPAMLAENINAGLKAVGYSNRGVIERPGLAVLRDTKMPSVLVEVGFIDSEFDNQLFDHNFTSIVQAIANGILSTMEQEKSKSEDLYQVQLGAYQSRSLAEQLQSQLLSEGFAAFLLHEDGYYKVRVGGYHKLDNAIEMERELRKYGYSTFIIKP